MQRVDPDPDRIALGIRQPWAELIVRGIKTVEVRTLDTRVRGTIYVYASKKLAEGSIAAEAADRYDLDCASLPRGMVVGSVELYDTARATSSDAEAACLPRDQLAGRYAWYLRNARRLDTPLRVRFLPYGVWFYPWKRRPKRHTTQ